MSTAAIDTPSRIAFEEDGTAYDPDTGEVIAPDDPRVLATLDARPPFTIETRDEAELALQRRLRIEGAIAALEMERRTLVANIEKEINLHRRRLAWWESRCRAALVEFARSMLGKGRTAQFHHGRVAFRTAKGKSHIVDMEAAVTFVRDWAPSEIKEEVGFKAIEKAIKVAEEASGDEYGPLPFLVTGGSHESVTITSLESGE